MVGGVKRALVVQHVAYEGLAGFAAPIAAAGYAAEMVGVWEAGFDDADFMAPDLLVVLGGPMGVYEREQRPWIAGELSRLSERLSASKPTLGVCLGSQMIAAALGAKVAPGSIREVGFAPITITPEGQAGPLAVLDGVPLLHWHGDGFELPAGATLLARTNAYPQAFGLGNAILALQCHPEMGDPDDGIGQWIEGADDYIASAHTTANAIRSDHRDLGPAAASAGRRMIEAWLKALPVS